MAVWGYPAAALPQLEREDSKVHLTTEQASWFASLTLMMSIPGPVIAASIYEKFGPRKMMLVLTPILCLSFMATSLASLEVMSTMGLAQIILLSSRVAQGSAVALLISILNVYVYEICGLGLRGIMVGLSEFWASLGYLICYFLACFYSWDKVALIIPVAVIIPSFIGVVISPESPLWLARAGKAEEALEVFKKVRCNETEILLDQKVASETKKPQTCCKSLQILTKRCHLKAVVASCLIFILNQFTGFSIIAIYVVHIFDAAGVGLSPQWSSVIVGLFRSVFAAVSGLILHRAPRRLFLIVGCIFTGVANGIIGIFFYLQYNGHDVSSLGWLPLFGLALYMTGYSGSVGATTWTSAVEVLPESVRSIGFGLGITSYSITAFLLSKFFVDLKIIMGLYGIFWLFSCGSFVFALVTLFYIPETLNKSLQDIRDYWEKH
ncbi:facilitated trehalose transporter Tret1-2 homolog isoform X2 [Macrobrachium nipponense]